VSATGGATTELSPLLRELLERIAERVPPERAEVVAEFARAYAKRLPADVAAVTAAEDLFGQVMGAFELADGRGSAPMAVRVLNPTVDSAGYPAVGAVVETNTEDAPFLVDSVSEELQSRGLGIRLLLHPVIGVERGPDGRIERLLKVREATTRESVMHFEVDRRLDADELAELESSVEGVLRDLQRSVADFDAMKERVARLVAAAKAGGYRYDPDEISETVAFLEWLLDDNFVFLGYREYELVDTSEGRALHAVPGSGLGILADANASSYAAPVPLSQIEPKLRERIEGGDLLTVSKTNRTSTVHRRARMDYIGVKRVDGGGWVVGELRLIGLFTSKAYMEPAGRIPLLRRKLRAILSAEELYPGSHDYKSAVAMVESFPLDELFAASTEELRAQVVGLLELQEQEKVRLFARRDHWDRSVSLVVALPRDRFNETLRRKLQAIFMERFHGTRVDYHLALGESDPALIHFVIQVDGTIPDVAFAELEREVVALTRTWDDRLRERLAELHGDAEAGRELAARWSPRLPDYYKSSTDVDLAVRDIEQFERLEAGEPFVVALQNERSTAEGLTRIGLYKGDGKVQLSDFMPILEALGLIVVEEVPTRLAGGDGQMFLHDFGVLGPNGKAIDVDESGARIAEAISAAWRGETESDSLDRLVLAGLDHRQVSVLRAYRKFRQRINPAFTEEYQNDAFAANPEVAAKLVRLFELRLHPGHAPAPEAEEGLQAELLADLDAIASLDQDRILRGFLGAVQATVRTNAFAPGRAALALKIRSAAVPDMPKPTPLYEIFVYSPEMEGVHLRAGKVARGGIRWSDRMEDYRTEILGLMKAQTTKNAVIVPTGSKGGFVLKRPPRDPDDLREDVRRQYVTLVHALLELTDNLVGGEVVHPPDVRVLDEDDPYLVVAADKGTGRFSDTANAVAAELAFWLGDAFASGGSHGYDHKALAITARGAWESVKRHFRELGQDVEAEPFTVVGIGDMSGDVFGNGMLLSEQIRLVAAFDHRHVFLDPAPDAGRALAERRRLFELPGSSWADYDAAAISTGGGVWPRSAKRVPLSEEAQSALGVEEESATPNEVIRAILRAPVDLLWNGGIGTYVKSSDEPNAAAGDRTNDAVRVDGAELRARVVGEGGNLGFTQRGRIEYALRGGRINTDFIDNSAGVDCSDHEVNLKILLGLAAARGGLTREERDGLLAEVVDDVVAHVLYDNYLQAQILSQEVARSPGRIDAYEDLMQWLEAEGILERAVEFLPSGEEMAERARSEGGMPRPELCVLLAYAKLSLKGELLASALPDDPYLVRDLARYFPAMVVERFGPLLAEHPLRRELVATIVANDIVNSEGITFVSRTVRETGATPAELARAYRIARETTGAVARWDAVEALDGVVDPVVQDELMSGVDWLVEKTSRWYLRNEPGADLQATIEDGRAGFAELSQALDVIGPEAWRARRAETAARLTAKGVPPDVAHRHAFQGELVHAPDAIAVARKLALSPVEVARAFFLVGEALHVDWLEARLGELPGGSRWDRWALNAVEDDLLLVRREAAEKALEGAEGRRPEEAVEAWLAAHAEQRERLDRLMRQLEADGVRELSQLTVAVRKMRAAVG
jgi:glutamate dehydrogenase